MLAAEPSCENFINNHSNAVKKMGKAKTAYHALVLRIIFLVSTIMTAKNNGRATVNMIAGVSVTTLIRYPNHS